MGSEPHRNDQQIRLRINSTESVTSAAASVASAKECLREPRSLSRLGYSVVTQNMYFKANCMIRGSWALRILPKFPLLRAVTGAFAFR